MLQLIFGKKGHGKTQYIYKQIAKDKAENENLRQILFVPDQYTFETERDLLKISEIGPSFDDNLQVVGFEKLARLVQKSLGEKGKKQISKACKIALMMRTLGTIKEELQLYKKVCEFDSFAQKMVNMVKEFKQSGITPETLRLNAEGLKVKFKAKMQDFALIYEKYDELVARSYTDSDDTLIKLTKTLGEYDFFKNHYVYIDGFAEFTEVQHGVIERILQQSAKTIAAFCIDEINSKVIYFDGVRRCLKQIVSSAKENKVELLPHVKLKTSHKFIKNPELKHLNENLFATSPKIYAEKPKNIIAVKANSLKEEATFTCRQIRKLVTQNGYRYNEIAVIMRDCTRYKGILLSEFEKYEIPIYNNEKKSLASTALFKLISAMFAVVLQDFKSDDVINLAKNNLYILSDEEAINLENYREIWRKTKLNWLKDFTFSPGGFQSVKSEKLEKENREQLKNINQIRVKIIENLRKVALNFESENAEKFGKSIYNWLENLEIAQKIEENFKRHDDDLQKSFEKLVEILEILEQIFDCERVNISEYIRLFETLANNTEIGEVPGKIDEVKLGDLENIMLNNPKVVFVLGANANVFPNLSADGFLNIAERKVLREKNLKINDYAENFAINEHFLAYNAFLSPCNKLYITHAKTDLGGNAMLVSPFLNELQNIFEKLEEIEVLYDICTATKQSLLDFVGAESEENFRLVREYIKTNEPHVYAQLQYHNLMPKNLEKATVNEIFKENLLKTSASKIEKFYACQFAYFLQNTLRLKVPRIAEIDAMQRGTILHYAIEKMVKIYSVVELVNMGEEKIGEINFLICDYLKTFANDETIENLHYNILEMATTAFYVVKNVAEELSLSDFKVHSSERKILKKDDKISLSGYVDRVDILEQDGKEFVRIVDYKTGTKKFDLNEVLYGQNLQMLIYLFKICEELGDVVPGGVLHMPVSHSAQKVELFGVGQEKTAEDYRKILKMNGVLLEDEAIVENAARTEKYLPISIKKGGGLKKGSATLKAHEFNILKDYVEYKISKMTKELKGGKIEINPLKSDDKIACRYCDFKEICREKCDKNQNEIEKITDFEAIIAKMELELEKEAF